MKFSFEKLEAALVFLEAGLTPPPCNDRERDGAIQRFEYTFEVSWKSAQKALREAGVNATTPRDVLRELGKAGWLTNVEKWFEYLNGRNRTSHTYSKLTADEVFNLAKDFAIDCRVLLNRLIKEQDK